MHIGKYVEEITNKMHELNMALMPLPIKARHDAIDTITKEEIEAVEEAFKALSKHLFDYED